MPYYVYAIHLDDTDNRLYEKFDEFSEAERMEQEMKAGWVPTDNYRVELMFAETDDEADRKADSFRPRAKRG